MNSMYWRNKIMRTMYTNNTDPFYIGLSSAKPDTDANKAYEPVGGGYKRVKVGPFTEPSNGRVSLDGAVEFGRSTAPWYEHPVRACYWVLFDGDGSNAHILSYGELDEPKCIETNTIIMIGAQSIVVTLSDYEEASTGG